jgi:hypothetical protein
MAGPVNNFSPNQNWQSIGGNGFSGYNNQGDYGGSVARGELDAIRIGTGRVPSAEYPDGYLGTIRTRRDDRGRPNSVSEQVLDGLKVRQTQRGYQRGVHRGERIDPSDYYLPSGFSADRGILRQMAAAKKGKPAPKFTPAFSLAPAPHLPNDGKANTRSSSPLELNKVRNTQLRGLSPQWR